MFRQTPQTLGVVHFRGKLSQGIDDELCEGVVLEETAALFRIKQAAVVQGGTGLQVVELGPVNIPEGIADTHPEILSGVEQRKPLLEDLQRIFPRFLQRPGLHKGHHSAVVWEGYAPGKGLLQHAAQVADGQLGQAAAKADFHAEILPARLAALQQPLLLQIRRQALNQALEGLPQGGALISRRSRVAHQRQLDLSRQILRQSVVRRTVQCSRCR